MTARTLTLTGADIIGLRYGTPAVAVGSDGVTVAVYAQASAVLVHPAAERRAEVSDGVLDDLAAGEVWTVVDRADRTYGWNVSMAAAQ